MYIKSINNVVGYKDLPDGFNCKFNEDITYIIGDNFQRKTTVGSLFNWCLTGCSLYGNDKEQVQNDKTDFVNVIVDINFIDNDGLEHNLIRNKAKETTLILDNNVVKQEKLQKFYLDKKIFLAAHNPYYFGSLKPVEQRKLLREVLPNVTADEIFSLLSPEEQKIFERPRVDLNGFTSDTNSKIKELEQEYSFNKGQIQTLTNIMLKEEESKKDFTREAELNLLKEEYENLLENYTNFNLSDIENGIRAIDRRLKEIMREFKEQNDKYIKEEDKLRELNSHKSICPSCKQEIKQEQMREHLINYQNKILKHIEEKTEELKKEAKDLTEQRISKKKLADELNTSEMQEISKRKNLIKQKIENLEKEKEEILVHNKEIELVQREVKEAKEKILIFKKAQDEITEEINLSKQQIKIANKLKILAIEEQMKKVKGYLDKVNIKFNEIDRSTGEIKECYIVQYERRDYNKLSKSQQIRACLEISNLVNKLSNLNVPVFLDDAESITDIKELIDTQMIISIVVKHNKLEILYDYSNVLERKKESIDKDINENIEFTLKQAA